ncbi:MAG: hypothetical protein IGBAC_0524 [Ignavibacteriae bacterium]|nr:MAG: hypothetical protein IGBAC_0524 [Ignavibacteriota bacterium]
MQPLKIYKSGNRELTIEWDDRHYGKHTYINLRNLCPCAYCKLQRENSEQNADDKIYEITDIEQVGSYAIKIIWADGHDTGIYSFEYLRSICECSNCTMVRENLNI